MSDSSKVTFTGCPGVPASYRAETRGRGSAASSSVSQLAIFERSCGSAQRGHRTWEKRCDDSEEKLPPSISKLVETVSPVAGQTKTRTPISHLPELKTSLSNVLGWSGKNLGSDSSVSRLRASQSQKGTRDGAFRLRPRGGNPNDTRTSAPHYAPATGGEEG